MIAPRHYPTLLRALDFAAPHAVRDAGPESAANAVALFEARAAVAEASEQAEAEAQKAQKEALQTQAREMTERERTDAARIAVDEFRANLPADVRAMLDAPPAAAPAVSGETVSGDGAATGVPTIAGEAT